MNGSLDLDHNCLLALKGLCFPKEVSGVKEVIITETFEALHSPQKCFLLHIPIMWGSSMAYLVLIGKFT